METSILVLTMAVLVALATSPARHSPGSCWPYCRSSCAGFAEWRMIVYGVILLVALRVRPQGLLGAR